MQCVNTSVQGATVARYSCRQCCGSGTKLDPFFKYGSGFIQMKIGYITQLTKKVFRCHYFLVFKKDLCLRKFFFISFFDTFLKIYNITIHPDQDPYWAKIFNVFGSTTLPVSPVCDPFSPTPDPQSAWAAGCFRGYFCHISPEQFLIN